MKQDRHGACDGCDKQKKLTLIHGRGLCINCEVLWNEAQQAMLDEVEDMLLFHDKQGITETCLANHPSVVVEILRKKYGVRDE